ARNASVNGPSIDVTALNAGNDGLCVEVTAGTITDGTHAFKLQDSIDGGTTWVDVAAPYLQTPTGQTSSFTSGTTAGSTIKLGYLGNANVGTIANSASPTGGKILVRLVATVTGATTGGIYSAVAALGHSFSMAAA
ncbi:MAG: hypothetical protein ACRDHW_02500, partial [Ktedonobacteraceae bacterium]